MKKISAHFLLVFMCFPALSQQSIDLSLEYPPSSGIFHDYSIYEPQGFNSSAQNKLMVGFHPFNPGTWDAKVWRDTLKSYIEIIDVLLVCPDGGANGRVDDSDDYDFTEALIDHVKTVYTIDPDQIFAIGFSVGGKAVYEYGLNHKDEIKGMIPIGAAINGVDFSDIIADADCRPFYLVHGANDSPNSRFYPMKTDLENNNALVGSILMPGVGHTINFPNRNSILKTAFDFVDTSSCNITGLQELEDNIFNIFPSHIKKGDMMTISGSGKSISKVMAFNISGKLIYKEEFSHYQGDIVVNTVAWPEGLHIIEIEFEKQKFVKKVIIY